MEELNKIIKNKNKLLAIGGILHQRRAFVGPEVIHIDMTNRCNFNCIACWCNSPLLGERAMPAWEKKLSLPFDAIKSIFDDLEELGGLEQVKLVGGGEPFMHPHIIETVEYVKGKNKSIQIDINTNFSLVDKNAAEKLLELGLDSFTVSLWAGSAKVYSDVHPNQTEKTFVHIKDVLLFIKEFKRRKKVNHPRIIIHNVIFNLNYTDVENMLKFALEVGADNIQFVPMDPVRGKTDQLLLNDVQRKELLAYLYKMKEKYDIPSSCYISEDGQSVCLPDFLGFIERLERLDSKRGTYDEEIVEEIPCYVGWLFARIMTTGNVVPCCKGHRMPMGNIFKNRFKDIWLSDKYNEFRFNALNLKKTDVYFSRMGNDAIAKTGCYNCDNLWQNIPMHNKITWLRNKYPHVVSFCSAFLRNL